MPRDCARALWFWGLCRVVVRKMSRGSGCSIWTASQKTLAKGGSSRESSVLIKVTML